MPRFLVYESSCQTNELTKYTVCASSLRAVQVIANTRQMFSREHSYIRIRDSKHKSLASKIYGRWFK